MIEGKWVRSMSNLTYELRDIDSEGWAWVASVDCVSQTKYWLRMIFVIFDTFFEEMFVIMSQESLRLVPKLTKYKLYFNHPVFRDLLLRQLRFL